MTLPCAGLLMLHLGVYGNCQILFESAEVPSAHFLPTELSQPHSADLQVRCAAKPNSPFHTCQQQDEGRFCSASSAHKPMLCS